MAMTSEKFSTAAGRIPIDVYSPASNGPHRAVLILHGTLGLEPPFGKDIESFALALDKKGIAATIPHYFASTNTTAGDDAFGHIFEHLPTWITTCGVALGMMAADPRFDAARIGVIGFSLGGHVALNLGMARPSAAALKAVVDFFAPTLQPKLHGNWSTLPPVLIHHGSDDPLSIGNSKHLVRELQASGRTVSPSTFGTPGVSPAAGDQFIEYPGQKHGFTGAALAASRESTVQFLEAHLK